MRSRLGGRSRCLKGQAAGVIRTIDDREYAGQLPGPSWAAPSGKSTPSHAGPLRGLLAPLREGRARPIDYDRRRAPRHHETCRGGPAQQGDPWGLHRGRLERPSSRGAAGRPRSSSASC